MQRSDLGAFLAEKRRRLGVSQLELSLRLGVSQRHLGFVETGRANAGRSLLTSWIEALDLDASEANAALVKAGHPPLPVSSGSGAHGDTLEGMARILQAHEPYPAFVFDPHWRMVRMNRGGQRLCAVLMPELWKEVREPDAGLDMIEALIDPRGLFSMMEDPAPIGFALLRQLRIEEVLHPALRVRNDRLEQRLLEDFPSADAPKARDDAGRSLDLSFETPIGRLSFVTAQFLAGLPQNAMPDSLRVEVWFPLDAAAKRILVRLGEAQE